MALAIPLSLFVSVGIVGSFLFSRHVHPAFSRALPILVWAAAWYGLAHISFSGKRGLGALLLWVSALDLCVTAAFFIDQLLPVFGVASASANAISARLLFAGAFAWALIALRKRTSLLAEVTRDGVLLIAAVLFASDLWTHEQMDFGSTWAVFAVLTLVLSVWSVPRIDRAVASKKRYTRTPEPHASRDHVAAAALALILLWLLVNAFNIPDLLVVLRTAPQYGFFHVLLPFPAGQYRLAFEFLAPVLVLLLAKLLAHDESMAFGLRVGLVYLAISAVSGVLAPWSGIATRWSTLPWEQVDSLVFDFGMTVGFATSYWLLIANGLSSALFALVRPRRAPGVGDADRDGDAALTPVLGDARADAGQV